MSDPFSVHRISPAQPSKIAPANLQKMGTANITPIQTPQSSMEMLNPNFNPLAMARRFLPMNERLRRLAGKEDQKPEEKKEVEKESQVQEVQKIEETAGYFTNRNKEFKEKDLYDLRHRIKDNDSKEEILRKVLEAYPDYTLADEALDFLLQTTSGDLQAAVQGAKDELNASYQREIVAGKNIAEDVTEFAEKGLGSPTELRDMYRDITGNPRDAVTLFEELSSAYPFEKMQPIITFLLQSLGKDLKSKGPSISRAELHRLFTDTRALQAILGIYRFFKSRMRLIYSSFRRHGLNVPSRLNFEVLSKNFVKYLQERYPSVEKAIKMAIEFGISEEIIAQIIVYTQLRDAVRGVAPRLFRNESHRQDVLTTFLQLIEELDEQLEEEEEEEEKKEKENE